jgi:ParB family transcriptional regulator, chromosome partitioning protein
VSKKPSGLGRGLDALIPRAQTTPTQKLLLSQIKPNPKQPRRHFDEAALDELANSIKDKGLLQPILVRPVKNGYEIVAGERRWRAAQRAGLNEVPVVLRELSDREALELAIIENLQREDLGPLEEARAFKQLLDYGMTQDEAAQSVGKGRTTVTNALRLLTLPKNAMEALESGSITAGHARAILAMPEEAQDWALEQILTNHLSVRQAEQLKLLSEDENTVGDAQKAVGSKPRVHRQLELELARYAGTKVRIVGQDKGKLELYYHNLEDLNRILELMGYEA